MPEHTFNPERHITNFSKLGMFISGFLERKHNKENDAMGLALAISRSCEENTYFSVQNISYALQSISEMLEEDKLKHWMEQYSGYKYFSLHAKTIGVIMAGNIPFVGFHDFLCVLITGNKFLGKLSHNDRFLLPALAEELVKIDNDYTDYISFTENKIPQIDAIIATGSNNSARYFEYYFAKYPHIIRKNRNSIAILSGKESMNDLIKLADDLFLYFGLGCRSASKLFVPVNYDFSPLIEACKTYNYYKHHSGFRNNFDYYKTIFLMNDQAFLDGDFFILQENSLFNNPVSVYYYEYYENITSVLNYIDINRDKLQCIIGENNIMPDMIAFGQSQKPELWDYADNIDTIKFLLS